MCSDEHRVACYSDFCRIDKRKTKKTKKFSLNSKGKDTFVKIYIFNNNFKEYIRNSFIETYPHL